jgi:hypothetical protein
MVDTTLSHVSHLLAFIWMISTDGNSKKEPLQTIPLHWKTRSEDIIFDVQVAVHRDKFL